MLCTKSIIAIGTAIMIVGCAKQIKFDTSSDISSISIGDLSNEAKYQTMFATLIEDKLSGSILIDAQKFSRDNNKGALTNAALTVKPGKVVLKLDYFDDNQVKVYSTDFCSSSDLQKSSLKMNLVPGPNFMSPWVCDKKKTTIDPAPQDKPDVVNEGDADVTINPNHRQDSNDDKNEIIPDTNQQQKTSQNPLSGMQFYVGAAGATASYPSISGQPIASWILGDPNRIGQILNAVNGRVPIFVLYNIPDRDCSGAYSAGGARSFDEYRSWIMSIANIIGNNKAVIIMEPDALPDNCSTERLSLIGEAVKVLKAQPNVKVYIDAGHPHYPEDLQTIIDRLAQTNVAGADGFALNTSNYYTDQENIKRGEDIVSGLAGRIGHNTHFVVDSSRNGNGSNGEWCNPFGRALGRNPTTTTDHKWLDAYLWIKVPGESDGTCNGGPPAGSWFESMANDLVNNANR